MDKTKPLHIFSPGRHVAMSGAVLNFSAADLSASARAYDPAKHEAPIVVGHPRTDGPAYGWVKSLTAGNGLEAEPHQVDPAFAELVAKGAFKKISASFYAPDAPQNPVPGVYYLRHVGFLGAQPPAVKGLRSPEFADAEEGVVEFGDYADQQNASLWRRLRDWIIGEKGLEIADSIIPDYAVATLEADALQESSDCSTASMPCCSEPSTHQENQVTPEQAAALEAENLALKQRLDAAAARDKTAAAATRHAANAAFAEGLVAEGKLLPAQSAVAIATLDFVSGQESVVEFGDGDAKKPLTDAVKDLLSALPKQLEFGESATRDKAGAGGDMTDPKAIAAKAVEFQEAEAKAGREISITAAVSHVTAPT